MAKKELDFMGGKRTKRTRKTTIRRKRRKAITRGTNNVTMTLPRTPRAAFQLGFAISQFMSSR